MTELFYIPISSVLFTNTLDSCIYYDNYFDLYFFDEYWCAIFYMLVGHLYILFWEMPILTNGAGKIVYVMQNNEARTLSLTN